MAKHIKHDWRKADLPKIDIALCTWGEKLTRVPGDMSQQDVVELEKIGISQEAISDAAQVVGYFNYINRIADGLGVDLEPEMEK
ncbi:MAG: peroxidase [Candidatus Marinimicrobia bacterium]|nr:peroxidase [Candidatus Neomarinimicrobiota bacterium]MBL7010494.1 peroxidase [Candidatus Neomarinimicrobiota bacterium]MBL7030933.1 peroxidase [Candidatus Neomarinimicrobiota bacterium]